MKWKKTLPALLALVVAISGCGGGHGPKPPRKPPKHLLQKRKPDDSDKTKQLNGPMKPPKGFRTKPPKMPTR